MHDAKGGKALSRRPTEVGFAALVGGPMAAAELQEPEPKTGLAALVTASHSPASVAGWHASHVTYTLRTYLSQTGVEHGCWGTRELHVQRQSLERAERSTPKCCQLLDWTPDRQTPAMNPSRMQRSRSSSEAGSLLNHIISVQA